MNWKAFVPLAIAIVLGLIAARLAMNVVSFTPAPSETVATNLTPIVVATGDIEPGTILTEMHLKLGKVENDNVPNGAYTAPEQLLNKVTKVALTANQPVLPTLLAGDGAGVGVGATLPEGMRAITVDINDVSGVAGFIQPSCSVDIVGTIQTDGKSVAMTILENIRVLAVGSRTGPTPPPAEPGQPVEQAKTVTLLCSPEQAEKLELAASSTRIRLVLRNGRDESTSETRGVTIADLNRTGTPSTQPTNMLASDVLGVPSGMRAYTMMANRYDGVAFLQPQDRVDVLSILNSNTAKPETLLRNVRILAVGTRTMPTTSGQPADTVTLLVSPEDAERLNEASARGAIKLVLRNSKDNSDENGTFAQGPSTDVEPVRGVDPFADVFPGRVADRTWTVEIIKGGQQSTQSFQIAPTPVTPVRPVPSNNAISDIGTK
jgi:pilus assembly protein CpaB